MSEEQNRRGHGLYSWWLAVVAPAVRVWFGLGRAVGWRGARRRRRLIMVVSTLAAMSFGSGLVLTVTGTGPGVGAGPGGTAQQAAAIRGQAAAWIAQQVAPDVSVACDPQMCGQVRGQGFPAARLTALPTTADGPLGSGVVVATPAVRSQFGAQLARRYAPLVLASFGSGADQVDVRVVAPDGAAAFEAQLTAAHGHLVSAGTQLLQNSNIAAGPAARTALLSGQVDSRLLVTLSALASARPLRLVAFGDASPGASSAAALRGADIGVASPAGLSAVLGFLRAQQAPYRPAVAIAGRDPGGQSVVIVRFDAPGLAGVGGS